MVARGPALPPLSLAAFLRSLLPAQPAPCPHGAGARAAFRQPGCVSPALRLCSGATRPGLGLWPPTRLTLAGHPKGFLSQRRRWLGGPAQPQATR